MQKWCQEGELGNKSRSSLWMDKGVDEGFSHWYLKLRCFGRVVVPSSKHPLEPLQDHRLQGAWDTHSGRKGHFL